MSLDTLKFLSSILVAVVYFDLVGRENILKTAIFHSVVCQIGVQWRIQIRGGGTVTQTRDKGGGGLKKNFFGPLGLSLVLK